MDDSSIEPKETIPASRKLSRAEALSLATAASKLIVCKGKKVAEFKPGPKPTKEMLDAMLGPTGNLRAPTMRVGKTVVVGFNEDVFQKVLS